MKEYFFQERGIYYRVNEHRNGLPTLLFIHGLSGSSSVWLPYEKELESKYNIVSLDLRGHGKSLKHISQKEYTPEKMASDVNALIQYLGVTSYVVVAHSFGTLIALSCINTHPERVSQVIFLSPVYGVAKEWWVPFARFVYIIVAFVGKFFPLSTKGRGHVDYQTLKPTSDWNIRRIRLDIRNTSLRVYAYCLRDIFARNFDSWWHSLCVPTRIIHGTEDTIISIENARVLVKNIPQSELRIIQGANHILPVNNVTEVEALIEEFIK